VTTKDKWEIAFAALTLSLLAWFYFSQLDTIGANDGLKHRILWWREQRRKRENAEKDFVRAAAQMQYEAWEILQGEQA